MNILKINVEYNSTSKTLETTVHIDGEPILWNYIEPFNFFTDVVRNGINLPYHLRDKGKTYYYANKISDFEPFTCTCGVAGCAGIWNGIFVKHRSRTVEWRCNPDDGYTFLKSYYAFDKKQYTDAVAYAYSQFKHFVDLNVIIEEYGYEEGLKEKIKYWTYWKDIQKYFEKRVNYE